MLLCLSLVVVRGLCRGEGLVGIETFIGFAREGDWSVG